jgi:hypothetical protein
MTKRLVVLPFLLYAVAACARQTGLESPKPGKPDSGPEGSIHAYYTGGLLNRTVDVSFRVNQNAFALVAHLGGDGVVRVLYPDYPIQRPVSARQTVRTRSFTAPYDGAPHFYSLSASYARSRAAMMDSYDGLGYGYIFMILSRRPIDVGAISDGQDWFELPMSDYGNTYDPRAAIRVFAEQLTGGRDYTLKFASAYTTVSFTSYADRAWDCSILSAVGATSGFWGSWGWNRGSFYNSWYGYPGCGRSYHAYAYGYELHPGRVRRFSNYGNAPRLPTGNPQQPSLPRLMPVLSRPTYRGIEDRSGGITVVRSALDRARTATTTRQAASRARSPFADEIDRPSGHTYRPSSTFSEPSRRTAGSDSRPSSGGSHSAPAASGPRASSPAPATTATKSTTSSSSSPSSTTSTTKKHQ